MTRTCPRPRLKRQKPAWSTPLPAQGGGQGRIWASSSSRRGMTGPRAARMRLSSTPLLRPCLSPFCSLRKLMKAAWVNRPLAHGWASPTLVRGRAGIRKGRGRKDGQCRVPLSFPSFSVIYAPHVHTLHANAAAFLIHDVFMLIRVS